MTTKGDDHNGQVDRYGLDPRVAESIKEIATIQAKIAALELVNTEIRPEIKELGKTKWGIIGTVATVFLVFMGLIMGIQHNAQVSDYDANVVLIHHAEDHLRGLEEKVSDLRKYVDQRDNDTRSMMFTKEDHEIFDKERFQQWQDITRRVEYLEHKK